MVVYKAWTNGRIRRYWKLPAQKTEARVRRLRWTQELSRRPTTHCQILVAMFGDVPFEETRLSNLGRIIRHIAEWAERILEDIRSIKETVYGADDLIKELDGRWMSLFCDSQEAERFQKFDMAEIWAREMTMCIPPWCGTTKPREEEEEDEEDEEVRWTCDHHDEEIPTYSQIPFLDHRRRLTGVGLLITKLFRYDVCANCESTFASTSTARNHLIRACQTARCAHKTQHTPSSGGSTCGGRGDNVCRMCEGVSGLSHNLAQTRTHLPRPPPIIKFFESLHTTESEMSGASSWQHRPVNEQGESATKAQRTG